MSESTTANTETSIKRSSERSRKRKPKKNQMPIGVLVLILMIGLGVYFNSKSTTLALFFLLGSCFGFILQKSRFCFTASFRDPCITGSTSVTRAVLIALAATTILFAAIKYGFAAAGLEIPGQSYVVPISFATVFGGIMFGVGMVIAGGCASGTLMRVGEGFTMQILSLTFFVIGSLWGAHDMGWWRVNFISVGKKIFLPEIFGWFGAVVVQLLIILCLYIAADLWEKKKIGNNN